MLDTSEVQAKAEVLLEALPYFQQFRGSVFVVKIGGSFLEAPGALKRVATDVTFLATMGIKAVLVHGGGKAISRAMEASRIEAVFRHGMRVTDAATIAIVEKTLNGEINEGIVEQIRELGGAGERVYGQAVFRCERLEVDSDGNALDLGFVGRVTGVDSAPVRAILERGGIPVVSPVASDGAGQYFNVNADVAASHLAVALQARRLVYLSDVPGLLRDPRDPASLISTLQAAEVPALRKEGVIAAGMLPKVESAVEAIGQGVHRVHFIDGRLPHSLLLEIFTDRGIGTEIVDPRVVS